ncbi:hypothetical protein M9H77_12646 [Catharanthus roseus]|uniref:Uncharacterized protein n=1 Tax=Catharanthus roseus TaxID=4058 RepID=A0ACC0BI64_CATRO|nr:hypothetical protein M9H77_12646 [Catharanthus roseus]
MRAKYSDPILILANPISVRVSDSYTWIRVLKVMEEDITIQDSWNGLLLRSLVPASCINDISTVSLAFVQSSSFAQEVWRGNPRPYAAGGSLHSYTREFLAGFAITLGPTSSGSLAKAKDILFGLELVRSLGFSNIQVQIDSMLFIQLLTGKGRTPWVLDHLIQKILSLLNQLHAEIIHVYREANQVIDALGNFGCDFGGEAIYHSFDQLPPEI